MGRHPKIDQDFCLFGAWFPFQVFSSLDLETIVTSSVDEMIDVNGDTNSINHIDFDTFKHQVQNKQKSTFCCFMSIGSLILSLILLLTPTTTSIMRHRETILFAIFGITFGIFAIFCGLYGICLICASGIYCSVDSIQNDDDKLVLFRKQNEKKMKSKYKHKHKRKHKKTKSLTLSGSLTVTLETGSLTVTSNTINSTQSSIPSINEMGIIDT